MGYYTQYTMRKTDSSPTVQDVAITLANTNGSDHWLEILNGSYDVKWYEHEKDMKEVSLKYPNQVIALHGVGEENGDEWIKYFYNGKCQVEHMPKWNPPPFDLEKLG